jgi:hypothetical protein
MTETTTLAKVKPQEIEHFDVVIVEPASPGSAVHIISPNSVPV